MGTLKKAVRPVGRPAKEIDEQQLTLLASMGLTLVEIARVMNCSRELLRQRYHHAIADGRALLSVSLKRKQIEVAMAGDVTMLIWLGKQYLGQSNNPQDRQTSNDLVDAIIAARQEMHSRSAAGTQ